MEILYQLRKEKGKTQKDLSAYLQTSQQAYSRYEKGLRQPDNETLKKLADFFEVSVDYLLGREEKTFIEKELSKEEKELATLISQLSEEEVNELSNFVDYIISKRK